jgi:virginiamycin B lyase
VSPYQGNPWPTSLSIGPDQTIWFAGAIGNTIGHVTTTGSVAGEYGTPTLSSSPLGITGAGDGAVWFTEYCNFCTNGGQVGRSSPDGIITEYPTPSLQSVPSAPRSIVLGPDNAVWYTDDNGSIGRIAF